MSHAGHTVPAPEGFVPHVVAHHFESQEQEYQSAKLGFWLFLATEILLFGGLFAAYFYYKSLYHEDFLITVAFENTTDASLSWYVPRLELESMKAALDSPDNTAALERLRDFWCRENRCPGAHQPQGSVVKSTRVVPMARSRRAGLPGAGRAFLALLRFCP